MADVTKGLAYISKNENKTGKQPDFKGFVNVTQHLREYLENATPDQYGCVKLELALWKEDKPGVIKGSVSEPYKKENAAPRKQYVPKTDVNEDEF